MRLAVLEANTNYARGVEFRKSEAEYHACPEILEEGFEALRSESPIIVGERVDREIEYRAYDCNPVGAEYSKYFIHGLAGVFNMLQCVQTQSTSCDLIRKINLVKVEDQINTGTCAHVSAGVVQVGKQAAEILVFGLVDLVCPELVHGACYGQLLAADLYKVEN